MFLTLMASGGYKPRIQRFGADHFDDSHADERKKKMSFFNWWNFGLCSSMLLGVIVIAYVEDKSRLHFPHFSYAHQLCDLPYWYAILSILNSKGSPSNTLDTSPHDCSGQEASPHPSDVARLYEVPESQKGDRRLLCHTNCLR